MTDSFVLDCSVTMAWCFENETSVYTEAVLRSFKKAKALVPSLWIFEVSNVLLVAERKKKLHEAEIINFVHFLDQLPIQVYEPPIDMMELVLLGRMHKLTSYDASYLELALRNGLPLATLDEELKQAAIKTGVSIYSPSSK